MPQSNPSLKSDHVRFTPKINHFYFGNGPFFDNKENRKKLEDVVLRIAKCSFTAALLLLPELEGFPLRMSGIDNSYKIDGDVLLVIHASIPPGVHRPTRTDRRRSRAAAAGGRARLRRRQHNSSSSWNYIGRRNPKFILDRIYRVLTNTLFTRFLFLIFVEDYLMIVR